MLVAALSDTHSNAYALAAVLREAERAGAEQVWFAGDAFGYYPWAAETFALLAPLADLVVLGNHDSWVGGLEPAPAGIAGSIAAENAGQLRDQCPEALNWLRSLPEVIQEERNGWRITLIHGTPADPLDGRYYPDDECQYPWLPGPGEILLLGQTHHPLVRGTAAEGLLLNPGSVGQPRDGNPMPSWALIDLTTGRAQLRRTAYDDRAAIAQLRELDWDEGATRALTRRRLVSAVHPA